ncbi:MAG TPA: endonuclease III [Thermodesulfobacteriota bacterium]|nr:endonuclease III [Thermodesulfobacteriota bacterium]
MPRPDPAWIRARSGPLPTRRLTAALARIARFLGRAPEALAVTKIARRRDPFQVLVACLISLRTRDEVTDAAAPRLLAVAPTPERLARLPEARIARLIYPAGFYRTKARTLRAVARTLLARHGGRVPDTLEALLALPGVGRKTANLVLTVGFGKPGICVDTHVHRIVNRLGFVRTRTPEETERVLRARLPRRWWIPINDVLVAFGRTVCGPLSPRCSICPAASLCLRVGVVRSR